jgi:hypothetical protein
VEAGSQTLEEAEVALQLRLFFAGDEAVLREIFPGVCRSPPRAAIQRMVCRSRSPPGASLQLGSRL